MALLIDCGHGKVVPLWQHMTKWSMHGHRVYKPSPKTLFSLGLTPFHYILLVVANINGSYINLVSVMSTTYIYCEKTGCNQLQPVFEQFSIIFELRQPTTQPPSRVGNHNQWSGCIWLGSVRFRFFFRSMQLNLQTLSVSACDYTYVTQYLSLSQGSNVFVSLPVLTQFGHERFSDFLLSFKGILYRKI